MAVPIQSTLVSKIVTNLVTRAANVLNLQPAYAIPVDNDNYKITIAEPWFCYLRFYGPSPVDGYGAPLPNPGAGRHGTNIGRRLRIYLYSRSGVDRYGSDYYALTGDDPNEAVDQAEILRPGHLLLEEILLNGFHNYMPVTGGAGLTIGPLHWIDSSDGPPVRKAEDEEGLTRSHLDFQIVYVLAIQNVEPAPTTLPEVLFQPDND